MKPLFPADGIGLRTDQAGRPVVTHGLGSFLQEISPPIEQRLEPLVLVGMIGPATPAHYTGRFGVKHPKTPVVAYTPMQVRVPNIPRVARGVRHPR